VLLLVGLVVLGLSGFRGFPAASTASPSPSGPAPVTSPALTVAPGTPVPTIEATAEPTIEPTAEPTPAPTVAPTPEESFRTYTVKSGDTLSAIASKYGTTSRAIADLNGIKVSTILHAGDVLKIPN